MWRLAIAPLAPVALAAMAYLAWCFHRLTPIRRLGQRNRAAGWLAAIAPVALVVCLVFYNIPTMAVVLFHLTLSWLVCALAARVIGRLRGRAVRFDLRGAAAMGLALIWLGTGVFMAWHVRETRYALTTDKPLPGGALRIAFIADAHLGITLDGDRFAAQMARVQAAQPDAVVVVGDFVDDESSAADMRAACRALGGLEAKYGVYYAYGNHDEAFFDFRDFTAAEMEEELEKSGVMVLSDESMLVADSWVIVGRSDRSQGERPDAAALVDGLDAGRYMVMLDHRPDDYAAEAATPVDLVLSGHTHGGHIFPMGQLAVLLGIGDSRYGLKRIGGTDFIVTSGISGWAVPIKTGCFSEFVVVDITSTAG